MKRTEGNLQQKGRRELEQESTALGILAFSRRTYWLVYDTIHDLEVILAI